MKKQFIFLIALLAFTLTAISCGSSSGDESSSGSGDSYEIKNLPSNISIDFPDSLKNSSTASRAESDGYKMLSSFVSMVDMFANMTSLYMMLIDSGYDQLSPGDTDKTVEFTFTREMANKLAEMDENENVEVEEGYEDMVGETMPMQCSYTVDQNARLQHSIKFVIEDECDTDEYYAEDSADDDYSYAAVRRRFKIQKRSVRAETCESTQIISWSNDKKQVSLVSWEGDENDSSKMNISYDETEQKMSVIFEDRYSDEYGVYSDKNTISVKKTGEKNGVAFDFAYISKYDGEETKMEIKGFADDDGGYITYTFDGMQASETFDENGEKTGGEGSIYEDLYEDTYVEADVMSVTATVIVNDTQYADRDFFVVAEGANPANEEELYDSYGFGMFGSADGTSCSSTYFDFWYEAGLLDVSKVDFYAYTADYSTFERIPDTALTIQIEQ